MKISSENQWLVTRTNPQPSLLLGDLDSPNDNDPSGKRETVLPDEGGVGWKWGTRFRWTKVSTGTGQPGKETMDDHLARYKIWQDSST